MDGRVIIKGEVPAEGYSKPVETVWRYHLDDPLAVHVQFVGQTSWELSLELFQEAFTSPFEGLYGSGNVMVEVGEKYTYLYLSNGMESVAIRFHTDTILEFLNQVNDSSAEEIVSRELDEFLSRL